MAENKPALTIILKGTFAIPKASEGVKIAKIANKQLAIVDDDIPYNKNDPQSSVVLESDKAPFKPKTDIVLVGKAYAPEGKPCKSLIATLKVGPIKKSVCIFGNRYWDYIDPITTMGIPAISETEPFTEMPIVYELAYGGIDENAKKTSVNWCKENPIGQGFIAEKTVASIDRKPLPNIEDPNNLITSWDTKPFPMGFGFFPKNAYPRIKYAGTFEDITDSEGKKQPATQMPKDFDFAFYNGAHPDLQVEGYLQGNEEVELINLSKKGNAHFYLSGIKPNIKITKFAETIDWGNENLDVERIPTKTETISAVLDTLVFLPDEDIFYQVWRGLCPLQNLDIEEIKSIEIEMEKI
jgi:hypothetical protein